MSMPKLLQLALSFKAGLQKKISGGLDATGEAVSSSWATKLQSTKWDWVVHHLSYKRMTSEGLNRASVSLQPVSLAEPISSRPSEVIFGKAPGTVLFSELSTARILRCRSATAPLPSHGRHSPTFLVRDGQGLPTIAVRHHMGGHDHHGPGMHDLDSENKNAAGAIERISRIGLWSDVLLTFGKGAAGWISGSTAIIADAVHSVSDIGPSAVTLWLVRTGILPADKKFPYGRGKFEAVGAFGISVVLLVTGCGTAWHAFEVLQSNVPLQDVVHAAWDSLGSPTPADATASADAVASSQVSPHANPEHHNHHSHGGLFSAHHHGIDESHLWVAVSAAVVSIGVKEALFWTTKAIGDRNGSSLIQASAWHHRSDAIASLVALVGVGGAWLGVPWLDPVASIFVSGMIVRAGTTIGKRSLLDLTDEGIQEDGLAPIRATVLSVQGVEGCHALRGRKMGSCVHIDLHIKVDSNISAVACRDIRDAVKRAVQQSHRRITDILVQVDPADGQPITPTPAEAKANAGSKLHLSNGPSLRGISNHDHHHHHYHTWAYQYDRGMSPINAVAFVRGSRFRLHNSVATIRNRKASTLLASAAVFGNALMLQRDCLAQ